jgi:hypothetical protein
MIRHLLDVLLQARCVGLFMVSVAGCGNANNGEAKVET